MTPGYLSSSKLTLIAGRDISDADNKQAKATALVSDLYVKYAWGGQNPIGRQILVQSDEDGTVQKFYVVGVYHYDARKQSSGIDTKTPEKDTVTPILVPLYLCSPDKSGEWYGECICNLLISWQKMV